MKRLNKKGITIVELIVSFVLVTVAVTYFYQTIDTVHDLYVTATKETQEYVDKTYAMRIIDTYIKEKGVDELNTEISNLGAANFCNKYNIVNCNSLTINYYNGSGISNNTLNINGKSYSYVTAINNEELNELALSSNVSNFFGSGSFSIATNNFGFEETITIEESGLEYFKRTYRISDDRIENLKELIKSAYNTGVLSSEIEDYLLATIFDAKNDPEIKLEIKKVEYDEATESFSVYDKNNEKFLIFPKGN